MLALNAANVIETGALTARELSALVASSFCTRIAPPDQALCLALDERASYTSPNYLWFRERFERFVYVDRVIVAASARGQGLARALYADVMAVARSAGHRQLCCEVNIHPANPASDAFHASLGFLEVGTAVQHDRGKTVRYLVRQL